MPRFAHVEADVRCPQCNHPLAGGCIVSFQWGYCPNPLGCSIPLYEVGEPLLWRRDRSGRVPVWSYFKHGVAGNLGDPAYADLLLRESEFNITACHRCGHPFAGIGVVVRGGIIREVRVFQEGLPACDVAVIEGDGQLAPKPEWDDHPMAGGVDGGWCERNRPGDLSPYSGKDASLTPSP